MKLVKDKRVRQYELTFLLPVSLTSDEARGVQDAVSSLVKKYKGSIVATEEWGKKTLAYAIRHTGKRQAEANYHHVLIEFPAESVTAFEQEFKLQPLVLRHLLVVAEAAPEKVVVSTKETESKEEAN